MPSTAGRALLAALVLIVAALPGRAAELDLSPYRGRVVLVDFWASWCAPCRESFPWMGEMIERYGDRGLTVVAINLDDDAAAAEAFLRGMPGGFHHLRDPEGTIPERLGVTVMPSSILFDREGRPVWRHEGFFASERAEYERRIVAALDGRARPDELAPGRAASRHRGPGVRPWERDLLADPAMRLDADALDLEIDDHIYFSKEASSGGRGFGGGGCGCN